MEEPQSPRAYASLLRRYQALVLDAVLYSAVFAAGVLVPEIFEFGRFGTGLWFGAAVAFLLAYEPLLVGLRGGTVGHFHYRIRVWDANADNPIGLLRAFGRAVVKGLLGVASLVLMLVTARAQSLHDKMFHSVVVPVDAALATGADVFIPEQVTADALPSRSRRILVITSYSLASLLMVSILGATLLSAECMQINVCNGSENLAIDLLGIGWLGATLTFAVLGWRGRLIGCRRGQGTAPPVG